MCIQIHRKTVMVMQLLVICFPDMLILLILMKIKKIKNWFFFFYFFIIKFVYSKIKLMKKKKFYQIKLIVALDIHQQYLLRISKPMKLIMIQLRLSIFYLIL